MLVVLGAVDDVVDDVAVMSIADAIIAFADVVSADKVVVPVLGAVDDVADMPIAFAGVADMLIVAPCCC